MDKKTIDWPRIIHLLKLGIFASLIVLAGDMLLGWGVNDPGVTDLPEILSRYLYVPDGRIFASALLGLIGIPIECLCWFAVYRMIWPYSENDAHAYRAGIIGCLAFGGCGVHVPCCMAAYLLKHFYSDNPGTVSQEMLRWLSWFLFPAMAIFIAFFFLTAIVQIKAFAKRHTPLPGWCWIFSVLFGFLWALIMRLIGNHALTNALATGWISIGNLWMMTGLLIETKKAQNRT